MSLRLDWCGSDAAKYAVEKWHYSKTLPLSPRVDIGVWEHSTFVGAVLFSPGANPNLARSFGLTRYECVELTRVALCVKHQAPTSKIVAIAVRMLRKQSPGLKLLVSYADPEQHHVGTIYQAMGWLYVGETKSETQISIHGKRMHPRAFTGINFGKPKTEIPSHAEFKKVLPKYKYVLPLCDTMKQSLLAISKPYPKRASSVVSDAPDNQTGEGCATQTEALMLYQNE